MCCWPSGVVIYMFFNAIITYIQGSITKTPWAISKMSPKFFLYSMILQQVELDKGTSDSMISMMKSGNDSFDNKSIKEDKLVKQTMDMLKKLE